jgi:hypothetical protein
MLGRIQTEVIFDTEINSLEDFDNNDKRWFIFFYNKWILQKNKSIVDHKMKKQNNNSFDDTWTIEIESLSFICIYCHHYSMLLFIVIFSIEYHCLLYYDCYPIEPAMMCKQGHWIRWALTLWMTTTNACYQFFFFLFFTSLHLA